MASAESVEFHEAVKRQGARMMGVQALSLQDQRIVAAGLQAITGTPEGVSWRDSTEDAVPGIWTELDDSLVAAPDAVILYVHGGGHMFGTPVGFRNLVGHVARAAGIRALTPTYRLTPENPFPAALDDVIAAYRALRDSGVQSHRILVVGDSSGAGLALGFLLKLRDLGEELPAAAAFMSPWIDLEATGETMVSNAGVDLMASAEGMRMLGSLYAGDAISDPYASPILGDYRGLCPIFIQAGGHETLLDDAVRLRDKASEAGVEVHFEVFPEMQHVFQLGAGCMPEADDAISKIGAYLRSALSSN